MTAMKLSAFAQLLTEFRQQTGRSGSGLAHAAGIDASYLSRIERGEREVPRVEVVDALARALNLTTEESDRLRCAAGYPPGIYEVVGLDDPALRAVAQRLALMAATGTDAASFRRAVIALCRGWTGE